MNEGKFSKLQITLTIVAIFLLCLGGSFFIFSNIYKDKIYPGVTINGLDLSHKTLAEAEVVINKQLNSANKNGLKFNYQNKEISLEVKSDPTLDPQTQIVFLNPKLSLHAAFAVGHDGSWLEKQKDRLFSLFSKTKVDFAYNINENEIRRILTENYQDLEIPAQDATLKSTGNLESPLTIKTESLGKIIDQDKAISDLKKEIATLDFSTITLKTKTAYPQFYQKDLTGLLDKAQRIISFSPLTFSYQEKKWPVAQTELADWLGVQKKDNIIDLTLNDTNIKKFINTIAAEVDKEPLIPKLQIDGSRISSFQVGQSGWKLNPDKIITTINEEWFSQGKTEITLITEEIKSTDDENIKNMGLTEIIGTGQSNFKGSPKNRRHNIKTGANAINGLLIKPGAEFSLVKALGKVDASTGYLPELVIKQNKTIPEFGGGLCQVATTLFRTALQSGLPITARQNHSYRVVYYEPAGTDAAVYDPWPDMRFINDTANYVLIQTRINGDDIYFDFWGTKDNRAVEISKPTVYNIVKPGETKIVETLDLPVGQKKCTESSHNGADAYFDYKVTYQKTDGTSEIKENRFKSHYVPWQAVCLIGVEKLSNPDESKSTGETTNETSPITEQNKKTDNPSINNKTSSSASENVNTNNLTTNELITPSLEIPTTTPAN
ncbi:MAG: VanW family protein [Planctomycetes bacterium]|jgi:vancomycin resistance protein YoaR|nr:VanW family protein [Planctomycetota bacterium]